MQRAPSSFQLPSRLFSVDFVCLYVCVWWCMVVEEPVLHKGKQSDWGMYTGLLSFKEWYLVNGRERRGHIDIEGRARGEY